MDQQLHIGCSSAERDSSAYFFFFSSVLFDSSLTLALALSFLHRGHTAAVREDVSTHILYLFPWRTLRVVQAGKAIVWKRWRRDPTKNEEI